MIRVVTWNVLADAYVRDEYYPNSDPSLFDRAKRRRRVADRIASYAKVDVLCLQEVDTALFALAEESLPDATGRHFKKRGKGEGCALFVRHALTTDPVFKELVFSDLSGHVALGVTFAGISVVTTHLKWEPATTPPPEHRGIAQLAEILETWPAGGGARILAGDFNADPGSEVLKLARDRGLYDAYASLDQAYTANSNGKRKRIDYILVSSEFRVTPTPLPPIEDDTPLPSDTEPSDHLAVEARLDN